MEGLCVYNICMKKVIVYCVQNDQLLVFRHIDFPMEEVGIQVPAGTVHEGETVEDAALRELREETGYTDFEIDEVLGEAEYSMNPYRDEIQHRTFLSAHPTTEMPERWQSQEEHDGKQPPTRFECFWIPLQQAHVLQSGQGALLYRLSN